MRNKLVKKDRRQKKRKRKDVNKVGEDEKVCREIN